MTDKVVTLVTVGGLRAARNIARRLVEQKLAACVNITAPIQSVYRWQGKVETAKELLLVIKSTRQRFDAIKAEVLKLHRYATPEIICLPIVDGSEEYLRWVEESVRQPAVVHKPRPSKADVHATRLRAKRPHHGSVA